MDHERKKATVLLKADEILPKLQELEELSLQPDNKEDLIEMNSLWRPEFANYLVEGTPGKPFGALMSNFNTVEANMINRRNEVQSLLGENEYVLTLTNFARLGTPMFSSPAYLPNPFGTLNLLELIEMAKQEFSTDSIQDDIVMKQLNECIRTIEERRKEDLKIDKYLCLLENGSVTDAQLNPSSLSLYFADSVIFNVHPRYQTLARNIRERRRSKVRINVPIFMDDHTQNPWVDAHELHYRNLLLERIKHKAKRICCPTFVVGDLEESDLTSSVKEDEDSNELYGEKGKDSKELTDKKYSYGDALKNHIYMDAMGFGMGCACLQLTFQAETIDEARYLYDQLIPLSPIMLALSAATPFFRGYIADIDCRWNVISASVDDRTPEERGETEELTNEYIRIAKSRYSHVDLYLCGESEQYNDLPCPYDEEFFNKLLKEANMDKILAKHFAHLFIRDPIAVYKEKLYQDPTKENDHFENIQSTNWQTLRFKPPPAGSENIGWRVEFRPFELQITDFENAALVTFIVLLTRTILSYRCYFAVPLSCVDRNMAKAHKRAAIRTEKFCFRKNIFRSDKQKKNNDYLLHDAPSPATTTTTTTTTSKICNDVCERKKRKLCDQMTVNEIMNGSKNVKPFPGLIPLVRQFLGEMDIDVSTRCTIEKYLNFLSKRSSGALQTNAEWMRQYVIEHKKYGKDSIITEEINYDLINEIININTSGIDKTARLLPRLARTNSSMNISKKLAQVEAGHRAKDEK
ncbi:hypothetical protein SNEBB_009795 [Seison nebaliae]|nr:hypothetical protein SNEBB_009795 [Seison nebaliae]